LQKDSVQEAYEHLVQSYNINLKLGRLDGICYVGLDLGQLLCQANQKEKGIEILERSRDGFRKLGQTQMADYVQQIIQKFLNQT